MTNISKSEWDQVHQKACDIANATLMNDDVLTESHKAAMHHLLEELELIHGVHPSIIATRADYTDDPNEKRILLERALQLAFWINDSDEAEEILDSLRILSKKQENASSNIPNLND